MKSSVLTIGTFDGVHRGHQEIIRKTCALAKTQGSIPTAITFEIPPRLFFFPSLEPSLLNTVEEKGHLLKSDGIGKVIVMRFNRAFAEISALDFFKKIIVSKYRARALVVGYNFGFGKNREGDTRFLEKICREYGIPLTIVPPLCQRSVPVSSGRIREALKQNELAEANRLLGRPYFVIGKVVRGKGLGRKLGFPTANIGVPNAKIIPSGVFAVKVSMGGGRKYSGVCNVGFRPTILSGAKSKSVEANLFHFSGNLYGRRLKVEFLKKIRAEQKFAGLTELKAQVEKDKAYARKALGDAR